MVTVLKSFFFFIFWYLRLVTVLKSFFFFIFWYLRLHLYIWYHTLKWKLKLGGRGGGIEKKWWSVTIMSEVLGFIVYFLYLYVPGFFFLSENCSNPFYIRLSPILKAIHHTTFNFLFTHNNRWRLCKEIEFLIFVHLFNTLLFTQLCSRTL